MTNVYDGESGWVDGRKRKKERRKIACGGGKGGMEEVVYGSMERMEVVYGKKKVYK